VPASALCGGCLLADEVSSYTDIDQDLDQVGSVVEHDGAITLADLTFTHVVDPLLLGDNDIAVHSRDGVGLLIAGVVG
jgi:hypothetical protein